MGHPGISRRVAESSGVGLGALLTIVLCGGMVVFLSFGIWMLWKIRIGQKLSDTKLDDSVDGFPQCRIDEKPFAITEPNVSRQSSLISTRRSPVLPPILSLPSLPTYNSLKLLRPSSEGQKEKKRSFIRVDDCHGRQKDDTAKEGLSREYGQYGGKSLTPNLATTEKCVFDGQYEHGIEAQQLVHQQSEKQRQHSVEHRPQQQQQARQQHKPYQRQSERHHRQRGFYTQKHHNAGNSNQMMVFSALQDESPLSQQSTRFPAWVYGRNSTTFTDLALSLGSATQRVREGASQISRPPNSSRTRRSPTKTPQSLRHINLSPVSVQGASMAVSASLSSLQTPVNGLIAEATQELQLPDVAIFSHHLQGQEWKPPFDQMLPHGPADMEASARNAQEIRQGLQWGQQRTMLQRNSQRRWSADSDASISTSILNITGEAENK